MKYIKICIMLFVFIAIIQLQNSLYSAERLPLERFCIFPDTTSYLYINKLDYGSGQETAYDSIDTSDPTFPDTLPWSRGVDWQLYDPFHRRIFFQEALTFIPIRTHVYDISTRSYFDMPYYNYWGFPADMLIAPDGEYIIYSYAYYTDTVNIENSSKTVVLSGDSLNQMSERIGFFISNEYPVFSFVSRNNNYLINPAFIATSDTSKEHAFIIYSLPSLQTVDTLFYNRLEWRGNKRVSDISANGVLFIAVKTDTTRGLLPGNYAFVVGWPNRRLETRFVPLASGDNIDAKLSPESDEIDVLYPSEGKLRRYPVARGRMLGEIEVPQGSGFDFFGTDGNLYLKNGDNHTVVDYRNNQIIRQFNFSGE